MKNIDMLRKNLEVKNTGGLELMLIDAYENPKKEEIEVELDFEMVEGRNILYAKLEEKIFLLDSLYETEELLDLWYETIQANWNSKFIMFGLGNGMYVRKLLKEMDKESLIFVYEPSVKMLLYILNNMDLRDIFEDGRVILYTPLLEEIVSFNDTLFQFCVMSDIHNMRIMTYPNYDKMFPEKYEWFRKTSFHGLESVAGNMGTINDFGDAFLINTLYNYKYMVNSKDFVKLSEKIPEECTGFVVSCGPSLNKNIEYLKKAEGRSFIVAVDSAVKVLLDNGITPDLYATIDPKKPYQIYESEGVSKIPFVCISCCNHSAPEISEAGVFFTLTDDPYINKFFFDNDINIIGLASGGSVACTAYAILKELGIKRIVLVGQDLAYTDNEFYAKGSVGSTWDLSLEYSEKMLEVEAYGGESMVLCNRMFDNYRKWFEDRIKTDTDIEVINATEGGARIQGAKELPLRDVINKYCKKEYDIKEIINKTEELLSDEQKKSFIKYMENLPNELEELREDLDKGISVYNEMLELISNDMYATTTFKELFDKETELVKTIDSRTALYYIETLVQSRMFDLLMDGSLAVVDDEKEELKNTIDIGIRKYELLKTGIDEYYDICERMKKEVILYGRESA